MHCVVGDLISASGRESKLPPSRRSRSPWSATCSHNRAGYSGAPQTPRLTPHLVARIQSASFFMLLEKPYCGILPGERAGELSDRSLLYLACKSSSSPPNTMAPPRRCVPVTMWPNQNTDHTTCEPRSRFRVAHHERGESISQ